MVDADPSAIFHTRAVTWLDDSSDIDPERRLAVLVDCVLPAAAGDAGATRSITVADCTLNALTARLDSL